MGIESERSLATKGGASVSEQGKSESVSKVSGLVTVWAHVCAKIGGVDEIRNEFDDTFDGSCESCWTKEWVTRSALCARVETETVFLILPRYRYKLCDGDQERVGDRNGHPFSVTKDDVLDAEGLGFPRGFCEYYLARPCREKEAADQQIDSMIDRAIGDSC